MPEQRSKITAAGNDLIKASLMLKWKYIAPIISTDIIIKGIDSSFLKNILINSNNAAITLMAPIKYIMLIDKP